jgi:hypothetical protein
MSEEIIKPEQAEAPAQDQSDKNQEVLKVTRGQLEALVMHAEAADKKIAETEAEKQALIGCCMGIMNLLGLVDENSGKVKTEVLKGDENWLPYVLKGASDVMGALFSLKTAFTDKQKAKAEANLQKKFGFLKEVMPLIDKYGK